MTAADKWTLRVIAYLVVALVGVLAYEAYTNGEKLKETQSVMVASTKAGTKDVHAIAAEVTPAVRSLNTSVGKLGDVADQLQIAVSSINRPCGNGGACGTLADVNRTLATVRGTFGQVEVAARHENAQLTDWDTRGDQLFRDTHTVLTSFTGTLDQATDTLDHASVSLDSINTILKDQAIHQTLANAASISGTADQVFTKATHNYLHPPKSKAARVGNAIQPYAPIIVRGTACLWLGVC